MLRLGRSGEYRIQPDFPAWGVPSLVLTSPSPALSRGHIGRTPFYSQQEAAPGLHRAAPQPPTNSFCPTFRYRGTAQTESACGRDPCLSGVPCVQLAAFIHEDEQHAPGASKITVCACASRSPPENRPIRPLRYGRLRKIIFSMNELGKNPIIRSQAVRFRSSRSTKARPGSASTTSCCASARACRRVIFTGSCAAAKSA